MSKPIGSLGFTSFILTRREVSESQRAIIHSSIFAAGDMGAPSWAQGIFFFEKSASCAIRCPARPARTASISPLKAVPRQPGALHVPDTMTDPPRPT